MADPRLKEPVTKEDLLVAMESANKERVVLSRQLRYLWVWIAAVFASTLLHFFI